MFTRKNEIIEGIYQEQVYRGVVTDTRVKFGGTLQHTVDLLQSINIFGTKRNEIVIDEHSVFVVDGKAIPCYN
jgi:hypothetical protein